MLRKYQKKEISSADVFFLHHEIYTLYKKRSQHLPIKIKKYVSKHTFGGNFKKAFLTP